MNRLQHRLANNIEAGKNLINANNQINRYGRHLVLPSFGVKAQVSLTTSSVLIVGIGGIGSSAALYLASSGVGTIGLLDHDHVDVSNLHRQIIHSEKNQGKLNYLQICFGH